MNETYLKQLLSLDNRDTAIVVGLYLSKFNQEALDAFEFSGFHQAYNVLGYSLGVKPKSINNYRDEFDSLFPNGRKGWRRKLKPQSKTIFDLTKELSFDELTFIIKTHLSHSEVNLEDLQIPITSFQNKHEFSASRLITGKAAEEYFVMAYPTIEIFSGFDISDKTNHGCGYDFKLSKGMSRYYVEVKGMNDRSGNILMTDKEHRVAQELQSRYCLFVVRDFRSTPFHDYYFDPLHCGQIDFKKQERQVVQTSYAGIFI
ncbi:MAG: DUF3883 domain-containing protein [Prevotella sp.]|nr:DUF3883 domain-containing protein [Prevotella sp.]